jgi:hypothetical protein
MGINDRRPGRGLQHQRPDRHVLLGFLREARGRSNAINRPGKSITLVFDVNNRGQIVGVALNPEDLGSPPPTDPAPMGRMA